MAAEGVGGAWLEVSNARYNSLLESLGPYVESEVRHDSLKLVKEK